MGNPSQLLWGKSPERRGGGDQVLPDQRVSLCPMGGGLDRDQRTPGGTQAGSDRIPALLPPPRGPVLTLGPVGRGPTATDLPGSDTRGGRLDKQGSHLCPGEGRGHPAGSMSPALCPLSSHSRTCRRVKGHFLGAPRTCSPVRRGRPGGRFPRCRPCRHCPAPGPAALTHTLEMRYLIIKSVPGRHAETGHRGGRRKKPARLKEKW